MSAPQETGTVVKIECEECEGTGRVLSLCDMAQNNGEGLYDECERCGGSGYLDEATLFRGERERLIREAVAKLDNLGFMDLSQAFFEIGDAERPCDTDAEIAALHVARWKESQAALLAALGVSP